MMAEQKGMLSGWLMKQDAQRLMKGWKKRWFQQDALHLFYFENSTDVQASQSKGTIDLKTVVSVQFDSNKGDGKFRFLLNTRERTYVLAAITEEECRYWVEGLNDVLSSLSQPLSTLISASELNDIQQRGKLALGAENSPKLPSRMPPPLTRHGSMMGFGSLVPNHNNAAGVVAGSEKSDKRRSAHNIHYIDYDPATPVSTNQPPPRSTLPSLALPSTLMTAQQHQQPHPDLPRAHSSFISHHPPALQQQQELSRAHSSYIPRSPGHVTPPAPFQDKGSFSSPSFLELQSTISAAHSAQSFFSDRPVTAPVTQAGAEDDYSTPRRKASSSRDIQMAIVREKDIEIARLHSEIERMTASHTQEIESTQRLQQELDAVRAARDDDSEQHRHEVDELNAQVAQAAAQATASNALMASAEEELREAREELARVQEDLRVSQAAARNAQEEARAIVEQEKKNMQDTLAVIQSETRQRDEIIAQLNGVITTLNKELVAKDVLMEKTANSTRFSGTSDLKPQLDKEREGRQALQSQCAYLSQEVSKLEKETKHLRAIVNEQRSKLLEKNILVSTSPPSPASTSPPSQANGNGLDGGSQRIESDLAMKILSLENEDLRQKYFLSIGRSLKLQTTMSGSFSNVSISELYDLAMENHVDVEDWPTWISKQISTSTRPSASSVMVPSPPPPPR